jgi:hypothetical protein
VLENGAYLRHRDLETAEWATNDWPGRRRPLRPDHRGHAPRALLQRKAAGTASLTSVKTDQDGAGRATACRGESRLRAVPPHPPKRPRDLNLLAASIVDDATSDARGPEPSPEPTRASVAGLKGGKARAAKLSPEERSAIARKAARVRWENKADRE